SLTIFRSFRLEGIKILQFSMKLLYFTLWACVASAIPLESLNGQVEQRDSVSATYIPTSTASLTPSPLFSQSTPTATLLPTIHWNQNTTSYDNLKPKDSHKLYYADDGISGMYNP